MSSVMMHSVIVIMPAWQSSFWTVLHFNCDADCFFAQCHYDVCCMPFVIMHSVIVIMPAWQSSLCMVLHFNYDVECCMPGVIMNA
jgi:hypothetical protein